MMTEPSTKPPASTAAGAATSSPRDDVPDRPTYDVSSTAAADAAAAVATEADAQSADDASSAPLDGAATSTNNSGTSARKRVFTFQKRWLHTLPIMEKTLPESALDAASVVALRAAHLLGDDGKPTDDGSAREVVVCMLCDDPSVGRETLKLWNRLNCRRGRIENHLMSKHPEFMLLLKQKREAEGDLAVQIFLQNMREGRCNVRNEISAGLYSHMQPVSNTELAGGSHKRAFGHDEFMMPTTTATVGGTANANANANAPSGSLASAVSAYEHKTPQAAFGHGSTPETSLEAESRRKRLKAVANGDALTTTTNPSGSGDLLAVSLLSHYGPAAFAQWRNLLSNKMVVVTGGEKPSIARVATNLWLLGANVLVSFADQASTETFAASYLTQFHTSGGIEPPRGVMLPLCCSLQSRSEIEEWSRSIASKFQVDFLINFVDVDASPTSTGATRAAMNVTLCRDMCEAFSAACMQRTARNSIINITAEAADNGQESEISAAVEGVTKSLSSQLQATNVQVNAIVLQKPATPATSDEDIELMHLILFLFSPASDCVSGSVLRHRRSPGSAVQAPVDHAAAASVAATSNASHVGAEPTSGLVTQTSDTITATTTPLRHGVELEAHVI